ncbi:MAG TPA: hypothetical protein PLX97_14995, partial [Gemmatales bacterium]|nr:hypothetical protein [Gemmatales bacterium]
AFLDDIHAFIPDKPYPRVFSSFCRHLIDGYHQGNGGFFDHLIGPVDSLIRSSRSRVGPTLGRSSRKK